MSIGDKLTIGIGLLSALLVALYFAFNYLVAIGVML